MDFGRPNAEFSRKMANGQLLLLALYNTWKFSRGRNFDGQPAFVNKVSMYKLFH